MTIKTMIIALPVGTALAVTYDSGQGVSGKVAGQGDYSETLAIEHNDMVTFIDLNSITSFTVENN